MLLLVGRVQNGSTKGAQQYEIHPLQASLWYNPNEKRFFSRSEYEIRYEESYRDERAGIIPSVSIVGQWLSIV